ncbi:ATP-binding cassette domain-containing protein [bacterium]|nr:ATP-binding cassette domain-containing protein [bacterium]
MAETPSGGGAEFDRQVNQMRWGEGGAERAKAKSLRPLLLLLPYVMRQKSVAAAAIVFLVLSAAANLAITLPVRWLGDAGLSADMTTINQGFLAVIALSLILGLFSAVRFYFFSRFGERLAADLRADVYTRLLSLSPAYFAKLRTGEAVSRLTADITLIETFFGSSFSMAVRSTLTGLGALILMAVVSWQLTALLFVLAPVTIFPIMAVGRRVRRLSVSAQDRLADAAAEATETLDAIDLVQAYGMETARDRRFRDAVEAAFRAALARINARAFLTGVIISLFFAGVAGVVWLGARSVISGDMTTGAFLQFAFLALLGVGGFATVAEVYGDAMRASGAAMRAMEILGQRPDIAAPATPTALPQRAAGRVVFDHVSFTYPGADTPSLDRLSFDARPGELVALVGPSGAGKSTVLRLLLRFFDPTTGRVLLDDVDARDCDPADWRARFAYVPQEAPIFTGAAVDNVRFGRADATDEEVREALARAEALAFLEPRGGLTAEVGSKGKSLSGGERQRIAIARALVRGAPVMLLDEATSALDANNERLVQQALERAAEGRTTFVIAHRLATVRRADRILVMEGGRIVEEGDHQSLVRAGGLYARLAELQFTGAAAAE